MNAKSRVPFARSAINGSRQTHCVSGLAANVCGSRKLREQPSLGSSGLSSVPSRWGKSLRGDLWYRCCFVLCILRSRGGLKEFLFSPSSFFRGQMPEFLFPSGKKVTIPSTLYFKDRSFFPSSLFRDSSSCTAPRKKFRMENSAVGDKFVPFKMVFVWYSYSFDKWRTGTARQRHLRHWSAT